MSAVLIYGADVGQVRETATALAQTVVDDLKDPFRVAELDIAGLKEDPARLADEAAAMSLTGGRRVVRVRGAGDSITKIFDSFFNDLVGDALIVVEADSLDSRSSLRKLFEKTDRCAAIACYADEAGSLKSLIEGILRDRQIQASPDAISYLTTSLGGDRMAIRSEIEKLALLVGDGGSVDLETAQATVGDSAAVAIDDVITAVAGGAPKVLQRSLDRALLEGANAIQVLRAAQRHFHRLATARDRMDSGQSADAAMKSLRPPVFFKQAPAFRNQLQFWGRKKLTAAMDRLIDAELQCKTTGMPADTICGQTLLGLAMSAQPRQRR